ncbi:phosphatase PAP2 family protein [Variovorax ginsengisoli]|uniref:Membrane-associated phospholipid phosphatase n=1 Tax=Variovorax ginsengisoli TaxID=363844 RepID=A0ABT9SDN6_9BURK|nr:phosphatase PAP2 family protein [Variovorax ginsengisoli]MDP9901876.1 membrane-associated phospholipid phosphatase [Variovorax ginsengisoli]
MPSPLPPHWTVDIGLRMRRHFLLKLVGTTAFTWLFFIGYFELLRHPVFEVTVMPLIALDALVPFTPSALAAYLSLWVYVGMGPGLQYTFRELVVYSLWISAMCVAGLVCFYFWPTAVPARNFDASGYPGFALLQGVDAAGNACPSMHVAAAMFTMLRIEQVLRDARTPVVLRALNLLWFVAIAWSTLATRQHVALDALAGAALGIAFAVPSLRWRPRATGPLAHRADRISSGTTRITQR